MPKDNFDNAVVDYNAVRTLLSNYVTQYKSANELPVLDDQGNFTGKYYNKNTSSPQDQPDQQRLSMHLQYMNQKYGGKYVPQKGMPIAGGFDPVDQYQSEGFGESVVNVSKASINESFIGVGYKALQSVFGDETPDDIFDMSHWTPSDKEEFMVGVGSLVADTPLFMVGGGIGSAVGKNLMKAGVRQVMKSGLKTGSKRVLGEAVGRMITSTPGSIGAFTGHTAIKEGMRAKYQPTTFEDYAKQVGKSAVTGVAMAAVGGLTGGSTTLDMLGRGPQKNKWRAKLFQHNKKVDKLLALGGEIGTFTVIDPAMEGRLPTVQDFSHALGTIVSLKLAHKIPKMAKKAYSKFKEDKAADTTGKSNGDLAKEAVLKVFIMSNPDHSLSKVNRELQKKYSNYEKLKKEIITKLRDMPDDAEKDRYSDSQLDKLDNSFKEVQNLQEQYAKEIKTFYKENSETVKNVTKSLDSAKSEAPEDIESDPSAERLTGQVKTHEQTGTVVKQQKKIVDVIEKRKDTGTKGYSERKNEKSPDYVIPERTSPKTSERPDFAGNNYRELDPEELKGKSIKEQQDIYRKFAVKLYNRGEHEAAADILVAANKLSSPDVIQSARYSKNGYEISTQGDKRFSAFNARLKDGRTIEEAYQMDVKGYASVKEGKGNPPKKPDVNSYQEYKKLWKQWAAENPKLMLELYNKVKGGKVLTDKFATTNVNQARALAEILSEKYSDNTGRDSNASTTKKLDYKFLKSKSTIDSELTIQSVIQKKFNRWANKMIENPALLDLFKRAEDAYVADLKKKGIIYDPVLDKWMDRGKGKAIKSPAPFDNFWKRFDNEFKKIVGEKGFPVTEKKEVKFKVDDTKNDIPLLETIRTRFEQFKKYIKDGKVVPLSKLIKGKKPKSISEIDALEREIQELSPEGASKITFLRTQIQPYEAPYKATELLARAFEEGSKHETRVEAKNRKASMANSLPPEVARKIYSEIIDKNYTGDPITYTNSKGIRVSLRKPIIKIVGDSFFIRVKTSDNKVLQGAYEIKSGLEVGKSSNFYTQYKKNLEILKKSLLKNQPKAKLAQAKAVEEANKRNPIYVRDYKSITNPAVKELIDSLLPLGQTPTKIHIIAPDLTEGDIKPSKKFRKKKTSFDAEREMLYGEGRSGYILAEIVSNKTGKNVLLVLDIYTPTDFAHKKNLFDPFYHITMSNLIDMSNYGEDIGAKYWSPQLIDTPMFKYAQRLGFGATKVSDKYYKVTRLDNEGVAYQERLYNDLSTVGFIKEIEKAVFDLHLQDPVIYLHEIQKQFYEDILLKSGDKTRIEEIVTDLGPVFTREQIDQRVRENDAGVEPTKQTPAGRLSEVKRIEKQNKLREKMSVENFVESLTDREGKQYLRFLKEALVRDHDLLETDWHDYEAAKRHLENQVYQGKGGGFSILSDIPDGTDIQDTINRSNDEGSFGYSPKKFQYIWDKINPTVRAVIFKDKKTGKEEVIAPITLALKLFNDMKITVSDYFKLSDVDAEYTSHNGYLQSDIGTVTFNGKTLGSFAHTGHEIFHHIGYHLERNGFDLSKYKSLLTEAYEGETNTKANRTEWFSRFGEGFIVKNELTKRQHPELYKDVVLALKKMADGKGYKALKDYMDGMNKYNEARAKDIRSAVKAKTFERDKILDDQARKGLGSALYTKFVNSYHGIAKLMEFVGVDRKGIKNSEHYALASAGGGKVQGASFISGVPFLRNRDLTTTRKEGIKNLATIFKELGNAHDAEDMIMHRIIMTADKYLHDRWKYVDGEKVLDPEYIGFDPQEITAFKDYIQSLPKSKQIKIEQASDDFKKLLDLVIDQQQISGLVSPTRAAYTKDYNPHYVTIIKNLVGDIRDGITLGENSPSTTGIATSKRVIRRFLNRQGVADNPLQATINYMNTAFESSTKRMVMDNLFENIGGYKSEFMEKAGLAKFIQPIEGAALEKAIQGKFNLDMDLINEVLNKKGIEAKSSSGAQIQKEDFVMLEVMAQNIKPDGPNIITYRDPEGRIHFYKVSGEIMEAFVDYANMDKANGMNMLLKAAKVPTDIVRMFAVTYNPIFMLKNVPRDILTALVQTQTKLTLPEIIKGYKSTLRMTFGKGGLTEREQQFLDSGIVESNFTAYADRSSRGKEAELLMKQEAKNFLTKVAEFIKMVGSATESGPRFAEFNKSLDLGEGATTARLKGRDITVNFLRAGKYSQVLSQLIPFFNPGIQGFDKMIRTGKSKEFLKVGMIRAASAILAPTISLWLLNKDEEWYKDLSPSDKALWWHLKLPGTDEILRFPKPYDFGMLFGSLPEASLNFMQDGDSEAFKEFSKKIAERTFPFSLDPTETIASIAALRPIIQASTNRNFYWDKPIVNYFTERKPVELQYYDNTETVFKVLGDNPIYKLSPLKIKQFASDITAGQSDLAFKGVDWVTSFLRDTETHSRLERKEREANERYYSLFYKVMPFLKPVKPKIISNKSKEFAEKEAISKIKALLKAEKIDRFEYRQRERQIKLRYRR